jgi:hypothetical protein
VTQPKIPMNTKQALERASSICRMRGIKITNADLSRILKARTPDGKAFLYFWGTKSRAPKGESLTLIDRGDFEKRLLFVIKSMPPKIPMNVFSMEDDAMIPPGMGDLEGDE